jgi:hypothetical protein
VLLEAWEAVAEVIHKHLQLIHLLLVRQIQVVVVVLVVLMEQLVTVLVAGVVQV